MTADSPPDPADVSLRSTTAQAQALDWFVRLKSGAPETAAERAAFAQWRATDPAHGRAFDRLAADWREMDGLSDLTAEAERLAARRPAALSRRRALAWGGAALAAGLAALMLGPGAVTAWRADHATATGEIAERALDDGSRIVLDGDSAVSFTVTPTRREATLLRGRVWFAVAADPDRPFTVQAGGGAVTALGTAFSVAYIGGGVEVVVSEHAVSVALDAVGVAPLRLAAGEQARYADGRFEAAGVTDPAAALAWRAGKLAFEDRPLAWVVEEIGRHRHDRIIIPDQTLAQRRISGVVDLRRPDRALTAAAGALPLRVRRLGPYLTVLQ
jgi:transmembrane sensor